MRTIAPFLVASQRRLRSRRARPCFGYILLETVIGTGLLILGLAVIGSQFQDSDMAIKKMQRRVRAIELAEQQLAELDLGLVELDSVDEIQEEDFGPRFPDYGWRLTTEPTSIEGMFRLQLDVLFIPREGTYKEDEFDHGTSENLFTAYAFRAAPQKVDLAADFGVKDEELDRVTQLLADTGVPGFDDPGNIPVGFLPNLPFEDLIKVLPVLMDAFHLNLGDLEAMIPAGVLKSLQESGALGELEGAAGGDGEKSGDQ